MTHPSRPIQEHPELMIHSIDFLDKRHECEPIFIRDRIITGACKSLIVIGLYVLIATRYPGLWWIPVLYILAECANGYTNYLTIHHAAETAKKLLPPQESVLDIEQETSLQELV